MRVVTTLWALFFSALFIVGCGGGSGSSSSSDDSDTNTDSESSSDPTDTSDPSDTSDSDTDTNPVDTDTTVDTDTIVESVCGDGVATSPSEDCDDTDMAGEDCLSQGYYGGNLVCAEDCTFDVSSCETFGWCGDGEVQTMYDEDCEGYQLNDTTCLDLGYYGGADALRCSTACAFDVSLCEPFGWCGDGLVQDASGEICDPSGENRCLSLEMFFGSPDCSDCQVLSAGTCRNTEQWGTESDDEGRGLVVDASGNVYIAGEIGGEYFVSKFNNSGVKEWTWQNSYGDAASAYAVAVDSAGNVYASGIINGDIDLTKVDTDGVYQWSRQWGSDNMDYGYGIAIDASDNIYVTGVAGGDLGYGAYGGTDAFIAKVDSAGVKKWTYQFGSSSDDSGYAVAVDATGNVYITGVTGTASNGTDIFLRKYNSSGLNVWARQWGTAAADKGKGVAVDATGNIYVTGYTSAALDGQTARGGADIFLTKYDSSGVKQWTRQWGTAAADGGNAVAIDGTGNIYITGQTGAALNGQTASGGSDLFLTKYNAAGVRQWTGQGGTASDDIGNAIDIDTAGNIYIAGNTEGALNGQTLIGGSDLFITFSPASYAP